MAKMSISIYMKGYYEDFCGFGWRKNKPNSNPNKPKQTQLYLAPRFSGG